MRELQIRCRAFTCEGVRLNKILVTDEGVVKVWDSVAGHYTPCHALTARAMGRIARCLTQNNMLRPLGYCPPRLRVEEGARP